MSDYIAALWVHWVQLMSGIVGLAIGLCVRAARRADRFKKLSDIPDWLFITVGFGCILWAGYLTWSDEREIVVRLTVENAQLKRAADDKQVDIEVERRRRILYSLRQELMFSAPAPSPAIMAGSEPLPKEWTEKRLREIGEVWTQESYLDADRQQVMATAGLKNGHFLSISTERARPAS